MYLKIFPDNLHYFHNIPHRSKRMMIILKMLCKYRILILVFVRLQIFFKSSFKGNSNLFQIPFSTIFAC